jgi:AcrR family transcriptional regulator
LHPGLSPLAVAARLFAATTMQAIAAEAGVALATVYLHFAGRVALVAALAKDVVAAPDLSVAQVEQEIDPRAQLRLGAGIIRRLNERSWVLSDILRSQRGRDEELTRVWAQWQERHLAAMRRAVVALVERGWSPARYEEWLFALACREMLAE